MDISKFTQKSQEALQQAQDCASRFNHVEVDVEHLLYVLTEQQGGLFPRILQKLEIVPDAFLRAIEGRIKKTIFGDRIGYRSRQGVYYPTAQ